MYEYKGGFLSLIIHFDRLKVTYFIDYVHTYVHDYVHTMCMTMYVHMYVHTCALFPSADIHSYTKLFCS
jgi:hypothetical protein